MRRALLFAAGAIILGIGTAECLTNNISFRRWIAHIVKRGELRALVGRRGIYDTEVERAWRAELFARGADEEEVDSFLASEQKRVVLRRLIEQEKLTAAAAAQSISPASVGREMNLLRWQFHDEKAWTTALRSAAITAAALRREAATNLRDRNWLEAQIAARIRPNDAECRRYFEEHRQTFQEPWRLRASHLFLAAPEGCPTQVIETKRALINTLAGRLANGESFPALVAEFSEDDATKKRDGDLGYFAGERMLPAVFDAARKLHPGETSAPVRSRLGFHIIRLTESLSPCLLTFEEALPEIIATLENEKRAQAISALRATLGGKIRIAAQRNQSQFALAAAQAKAATKYGAS
jgi:peptidyl-prolyl cis-trans isomerase C